MTELYGFSPPPAGKDVTIIMGYALRGSRAATGSLLTWWQSVAGGGWFLTLLGVYAPLLGAQEPVAVRFDFPPAIAAQPLEPAAEGIATGREMAPLQWRVPLEFSTLVTSPAAPPLDQILLEIELQDPTSRIVDYAPRTSLSSPITGEILIEQSDQTTSRLRGSLQSLHPVGVHGQLHGEVEGRQWEVKKFAVAPPLELVSSSGTTGRHQGVFFKLRGTQAQVLEGDKRVEIVVQTPSTWRQGLLRVRARGQRVVRPLPGLPAETRTLADQSFLVAIYHPDDRAALAAVESLTSSLHRLHQTVSRLDREIRRRAAPTVFHEVATKLELSDPKIPPAWLDQVLFHDVDVAHDRQLRHLPVDVRVAILDYQEAKTAFLKGEVRQR